METKRTCGTCGQCRSTHDGPYCFKGSKPHPVSLLREMDCWVDPDEVAQAPTATKVCSHCGRELPVENFGRHSRTKDGYQPCCKECQSKQNSGKGKRKPFTHNEAPAMPEEVRRIVEENTPAPQPRKEPKDGKPRGRKILHPDIEKDGVRLHWCGCCKQYKPVAEFSKDGSNKSGLATQCKACRVRLEHERRVKRREEKAKVAAAAAVAAKIAKEYVNARPEVKYPAGGIVPEIEIEKTVPKVVKTLAFKAELYKMELDSNGIGSFECIAFRDDLEKVAKAWGHGRVTMTVEIEQTEKK